MQLVELHIRNFRFIRDVHIRDIEQALILVGKNSSGKTSVLRAIQAVFGTYAVQPEDFNEKRQNIEIGVKLSVSAEDRVRLFGRGAVSSYRRREAWEKDFCEKLPSLQEGILSFDWIANQDGQIRFQDGLRKHNPFIGEVLPKLYYLDSGREMVRLQEDLLVLREEEPLTLLREGCCMFDRKKHCRHCFQCIGLVCQKKPEELNAIETARLMEYKLYQMNLDRFSEKVNQYYHRNGGLQEEILYTMQLDIDRLLNVKAEIYNPERGSISPVEQMGKGMRSIYLLSLLEASLEEGDGGIILMEDPELFLHPKLQKVSSEILYRLSKKNQVVFSTHSPTMLFQFNRRQIRQMYRNGDQEPSVREQADVDVILDDLGYTAGDLLNVDFVFIVEGKQDKSRLPLLLGKYYSEVADEEGHLSRVAIITTNSCTNIKTYANLKYMNNVYLRDQFLMIRDGDGLDREELTRQLCGYYEEQRKVDVDRLPRVLPKNVLILKYYSFENYFLNPVVMEQLGIVKSEDAFYQILFKKWNEYLGRMRSGLRLKEVLGRDLESPEDVKAHMEEIKTYMRGHNLFDLFYGPYKKQERELLERYVELAPREDFADILEPIDRFVYFENRRKR